MIPRGTSRVKPPAHRTAATGGREQACQEDGRHKPSSVSRLGRRAGSSVWDPDRSGPRAAYPGLDRDGPSQSPLFGLAPDGVCHATPVASGPVCSYHTLSPLPVPRCRGHRRSALCCTFRHLAVPGRYPASRPVELGLSSARRIRRIPGGDPSARPPDMKERWPPGGCVTSLPGSPRLSRRQRRRKQPSLPGWRPGRIRRLSADPRRLGAATLGFCKRMFSQNG